MAPSSLVSSVVVSALLSAVSVQAHGIASALVIDSTFYNGYNPSYQYESPPPTVVGWSVPDDLQNTFISPDKFATSDIICHLGATPAGTAAPVKGGDVIEVQWTPWPLSHKGPVLDYLANCNGPCETADKTKLEFFKIGEVGWVDQASDLWAANVLTNNNNSWLVRIPEDIAPGNYVLRHEIIALHAAGSPNGAQSYPFCYNLVVDSQGSANPDGVPATAFYKADDPGILFDLFSKPTTYVLPGPALYSGALPVTQTTPGPITATATGVYAFTAAAAAAHARDAIATPVAAAASAYAVPTTLVAAARAASPAVPLATPAL